MNNVDIANLRRDYKMATLLEENVLPDPIAQFQLWWDEAIKSEIEEVNAMTLATASPGGLPSARIVLLKYLSQEGFTFFSNYTSNKGKQLEINPFAALIFFWKELERQVRIEGTVEKIAGSESDAYFITRPIKSKISAWASPQSSVVSGRQFLEDSMSKYNEVYTGDFVPRPEHWGGYIVKPKLIEFWQGRRSRLHDRIQYTRQQEGWKIERLAP